MEAYSALELDSHELAVNRGETNVQEFERTMSRQEVERELGISRRRAIIQQATREPSINYDRAAHETSRIAIPLTDTNMLIIRKLSAAEPLA